MSYQVLARKYRPQKFSDVIGQEHVTRTLKNAIEQARIAHGYIFSGHRGIGKTTIARVLAMALNCRSGSGPMPEPCGVCESCTEIRSASSVDVIEIDAATNRGIDEIRELREAARYRPARDRYKIWILDEAHQITDAAFNALLKTLEEPPSHVVFMMATTQPEDIPQTIRSRCQHFSFHAVRFDEIVGQLKSIADKEGISADTDALSVLAEVGDGSMRDALSIMDQAIACCGDTLTGDVVRQLVGAVSSEVMEEILSAVERGSSEEVLRQIDKLLTEGQSPQHFAGQMVRFLRNALVAKVAGAESALLQISSDERARAARVAEKFQEEDLTRFLQLMLRTHGELGYKQEQRFHLELGLLKLVHAQRLLPLEQILSEAQAPGEGKAAAVRPVQGNPGAPPRIATGVPPVRTSNPPGGRGAPATSPRPSPFESDLARKREAPVSPASPSTPKASAPNAYSEEMAQGGVAVAVAPQPEVASPSPEISVESLRALVLGAVQDSSGLLEEGEWELRGNELVIKVAASQTVAELALSADARRAALQAASTAAGRNLKLRITGGGSANGNHSAGKSNGSAAKNKTFDSGDSGARARASRDPIVQRMQEKFGAEIRTVIDKRDRQS
jgi:DNA polymerase-3 subunit gamma/tau